MAAVKLADRENVGLGIDAFQVLARSTPPAWFDAVPGDRIFLVQLADYLWDLDDLVETSGHHRVFPSEGNHGAIIAELVAKLASIGYTGRFHAGRDERRLSASARAAVAGRARNAARWTIDSLHPSGRSA